VRAFPFKRQKGGDLPAEHTLHHRLLAGLRAVVAPLRIVNRRFGYAKVRYRGLFKTGQPRDLLFAPGNLHHVRTALTAAWG
jgi:IS5 family transposase